MRSRKRRDKTKEQIRNFLLVLFAGAVVFIFFNLDFISSGESVFSKSADKKLKFTGTLKQGAYAKDEIARLLRFVKRYDKKLESVKIRTSPQDSYAKITNDTEILFEINMIMSDGGTISTPVRRARRERLVTAILEKLNKDVSAYLRLRKEGKEVDSLVNTM